MRRIISLALLVCFFTTVWAQSRAYKVEEIPMAATAPALNTPSGLLT